MMHTHYIGSCRCAGGELYAPHAEVRAAWPKGTTIEFVAPRDSPWGRDQCDDWQSEED